MKIIRSLKNKIKKRYPRLIPIWSVLRNSKIKILQWEPTYWRKNFITGAFGEFMHDELFKKSFATAQREGHAMHGNDLEWNGHVSIWAAAHCLKLDGDFVECGVAQGFLSRTIMEYFDWNKLDRKFYLIDTYDGFDINCVHPEDKGTISDEDLRAGYPDMYDFVIKAFARFENVIIVKGSVPSILQDTKIKEIKKVAYLSIDMNMPVPEIAATEFFWDKIVSGGIILLDDFAHHGTTTQHKEWDRWAKEKGLAILSLPTGQGIIIKP